MTEKYYMCPFCLSSWICEGPHIEEKDIARFYHRVKIEQGDLAEFAKELVLEHGDKLDVGHLANMLEEKIKNRQIF